MQSTSDSTNMGWIWSGSCGAGGIYTLVTHISSNHVHFCVGFALSPLLPSALCCQNSKGEGCLLSLISSFPSSPSLFTFTTFYCTVLILSITSCIYIYINLWMHSGNTVLPCITWCTYPVTWHAILLCDPLTLGWNTCFLPMADTMMEAAPIKLQWLCDWCMHGDKDATTLVLRSLLLLGLIHCVWFEHVSPKLHVSAQFT